MTINTVIPQTQIAIRQGQNGVLEIHHDHFVPNLKPDQVLIKTVAVACNPCDYKMPTNFPTPGATDGSDFAGTVVAIGAEVSQHLRIGDRVAGAVHASNPADLSTGAFAQYVAAYADLVWKIPEGMKWENAAAIGGAVIGSLELALLDKLGLPAHPERPAEKPFYALVYGGSTASGTMAIQLLKR